MCGRHPHACTHAHTHLYTQLHLHAHTRTHAMWPKLDIYDLCLMKMWGDWVEIFYNTLFGSKYHACRPKRILHLLFLIYTDISDYEWLPLQRTITLIPATSNRSSNTFPLGDKYTWLLYGLTILTPCLVALCTVIWSVYEGRCLLNDEYLHCYVALSTN
jgi:hypothetical protein